jgi:uncharacterized spore protein YtfJ
MDVRDVMNRARDTLTVKRVFGEPIERNGLIVIPVARVMGGAGGGTATSTDQAEGAGAGAGFGLRATPAGVYVIRGETVEWQPALNLNRVILGGQLVAIVLILAISVVLRARASRQPTEG